MYKKTLMLARWPFLKKRGGGGTSGTAITATATAKLLLVVLFTTSEESRVDISTPHSNYGGTNTPFPGYSAAKEPAIKDSPFKQDSLRAS